MYSEGAVLPHYSAIEQPNPLQYSQVDKAIQTIEDERWGDGESVVEKDDTLRFLVHLYDLRRELALAKLAEEPITDPEDVDIAFGALTLYYERPEVDERELLTKTNPFGFKLVDGEYIGKLNFMPFRQSTDVARHRNLVAHIWMQDFLAWTYALDKGLLPDTRLIHSVTNAASARMRSKNFGFEVTRGDPITRDQLNDLSPDEFVTVWAQPSDLISRREVLLTRAERLKKHIERELN